MDLATGGAVAVPSTQGPVIGRPLNRHNAPSWTGVTDPDLTAFDGSKAHRTASNRRTVKLCSLHCTPVR